MEAQDFIDKLNLISHPEGGYFSENYRNKTLLNPEMLENRYEGSRNLATSIYYLLNNKQVSKFHRLKSDELWYFHYGSALLVHIFNEGKYTPCVLGYDVVQNQHPQIIIPAGAVFGAEVIDKKSFTLMGCMVTPGFHFKDFGLVLFEEIADQYPDYLEIIRKLT